MGFSLKRVGNIAGKAVGAGVGSYFFGPIGAMAGYSGSDAILGTVGLGDDQLAAEENWKYQKKAADYAYNQNLAMWNLQNAYNDPASQMARLQAAGLNPNLVYGGGNVTGNTASSGPEYKTSTDIYQNKSVERKQLALALEEHQQRITNQSIENDLARQRLVLAEREADRSDALAEAQIAAYKANLGMIDYNQSNIMSQIDSRRQQTAYRQYKADLAEWEKGREKFVKSPFNKVKYKDADREYQIRNRRPMLMDYLNR